MKIAMFLDVDKTLTRNFIQHEYARLLKCEDRYLELEGEFQQRTLTAAEFGDQLIRVFASKGFKEQHAKMMFEGIALQPWADE